MTQQSLIDHYKFKLRLDQWDIRLDPQWDEENTDDSATADIRLFEQAATVRIRPDVEGLNVDAHIVHEMTHILIADYSRLVKTAIAKLGPGAEAILDALGDMEERICDSIAHALTGVTYIPVGKSKEHHAPFLDTTTCTG